jgi:hypothetical protein
VAPLGIGAVVKLLEGEADATASFDDPDNTATEGGHIVCTTFCFV